MLYSPRCGRAGSQTDAFWWYPVPPLLYCLLFISAAAAARESPRLSISRNRRLKQTVYVFSADISNINRQKLSEWNNTEIMLTHCRLCMNKLVAHILWDTAKTPSRMQLEVFTLISISTHGTLTFCLPLRWVRLTFWAHLFSNYTLTPPRYMVNNGGTSPCAAP